MRSWQAIALSTLFLVNPPSGATTEREPAELQRVSQHGETEELSLRSQILDEKRTLFVRLPRGYDSGEARYPVLFLLDAEWHFNIAAADVEMLSECSYVDPHPTPQLIVVGIVNNDRNRDFTPTKLAEFHGMRFPTSGGAGQFRRFLIDEVLPAIDGAYRTEPYRILAGWSLGGLFTIDTLLSESPVFNSYLAISPSMWWDDRLILNRLAARRDGAGLSARKQLIVTLGTAEKDSSVENSTSEFLDRLTANPLPNLTAELVPIEGLGHNYSPKMAYFLGLATNFADWHLPDDVLENGLAAIDTYYASLTSKYGFPVSAPEGAYSKLGWELMEQGRHDDSLEVFSSWVARYPRSPVALASLGSFYRETGEPGKAVEMLRKGLEAERGRTNPRLSFILDLERDIEAIGPGN